MDRQEHTRRLWFDVGIVRYTTYGLFDDEVKALWFDVGIVRYTTGSRGQRNHRGCGLM